ncbi:MAG: guanylate kinase [Schwartzia sp.]|nr:guanylate kinase [Schwartzia sp. (in: firmicutes)]
MNNKIYALIGPHACGKGDIIMRLAGMGIHYIASYTTRPPVKYFTSMPIYNFVSKEEFLQRDFLVKSTYKGDYYGFLKKEILDSLQEYPISVIMVDTIILKQLSKLLKDSFESIFVMCDYVSLVERMLKLGHTNSEIKYHLEYAENNGEFDTWKVTNHIIKSLPSEERMTAQALSIMGLSQTLPPEEFKARTKKR